MTCPDWPGLVAARERGGGEDPPGWREALEHLEDCPRCRGAAVEAEPLLALRRVPEPPLEADEGRRMVAATRALRRRQSVATRWRRRAAAAVAAVTVGGALAVGSGVLEREGRTGNEGRRAGGVVAQREGADDLPSMTRSNAGAPGIDPRDASASSARTPSLVGVERSTAHVYEVTDAELALVVVVDSELELGDRG